MISRYQVTAEESTERSLPGNGAGQRSLAYGWVNMIMIKKFVVKGRCLGWAEEKDPKQENPAEIPSPATSGTQDDKHLSRKLSDRLCRWIWPKLDVASRRRST